MALHLIKYVPLSVLRGLATVCACIANTFHLGIYRSIWANLTLINPEMSDEQKTKLSKKILKNQLLSIVDTLKSWAMPPAWSVKKISKVHQLSILEAGFAHPNGMLLVVPHLGTWEMMNPWINSWGSPTIMYKPIKQPTLNNFVLASRERTKSTLVPTDATGVKAVFKALKNGEFSVILPDHVPDLSGGVVVPFFGIETLSSTLTSKLAQKTHCALVGLSCIRTQTGDYEVFCYELDDPKLYDKDIHVATAALNRAVQSIIEPHFEHYMWGYRRFRETPLIDNPYPLSIDELTLLAKQLHARTQSKDNEG